MRPYYRPNYKEGYRPVPPYSGPQVVRRVGRLLTLALMLSLPLVLALLALHLAGYLPAPATRPRHAMVQYCDRDIPETHGTCRTWGTTLVAGPVAPDLQLCGGPRPPSTSALCRPSRRRPRGSPSWTL
jgi:hypothetical protein